MSSRSTRQDGTSENLPRPTIFYISCSSRGRSSSILYEYVLVSLHADRTSVQALTSRYLSQFSGPSVKRLQEVTLLVMCSPRWRR